VNNKPTIYQSQVKDVVFGENVKVVEPLNIYGCEIGDNTFIGPFVEIQKDVKIGKNCKVQSHSFICELVTIGDNTVIGAGSVVLKNIPKNCVACNIPCKILKKRKLGEKYL